MMKRIFLKFSAWKAKLGKKVKPHAHEVSKDVSLKPSHHDDRQVWYMPRAVILNELESRRYVLIASGIICAILFALLVWSSFVVIDETAVAYGELVPVGKISLVQHLEGGIVKSIKVQDGDFVKKGAVLATIDETASQSELKQLLSRKVTLSTNINRLRAFIRNGQLDLEAIKKEYQLMLKEGEGSQQNLGNLIESERELLALENKLRQDQQDVLNAQFKQKISEKEKLSKQILLIERNKKLLKEELTMYEDLVKNHYVSKREYLAKKREYNQLESEYIRLSSEVKKTEEGINETKEQLEELQSNLSKEAMDTLNKMQSELYEVEYAINKLSDKVRRSAIRAPISGVIKGIKVTPGSVAQPGAELMTVVPEGEELQGKVRITTLDVGHVQPGDHVKVKVMTYNFARYGSVEGTLLSVSASSFMDREGKPYFEGIVKLDRQYVGAKNRELRAGMTVQADIVTGQKTLLQYLLKPIHVSLRSAFHER